MMKQIDITIDRVRFAVELGEGPRPDGSFLVVVDGAQRAVRLAPAGQPGSMALALVDGRPYELLIDPELRWLQSARGRHALELRDVAAPAPGARGGDGRLRAPIPGTVLRLLAAPGESVAAGQPLVILEAMKMQNELRAPRAGLLSRLHVQVGQSVGLNELIAEIGEPA